MSAKATIEGEQGLERVVDELLESYRSDARAQHVGRQFLPSRAVIVEILEHYLELMYPGYFGTQGLEDETVAFHVGAKLAAMREKLEAQVECCLCHVDEVASEARGVDVPRCRARGKRVARAVIARLPAVRRMLLLDVQAAFDGDPAAGSLDEIILAYPGLLATSVYRFAHEIHSLGVPLMPRIMTEWAHAQTGADIHPGATIGESFFLDHATGVVIGETTTIGAHVKLYQGVTLGALSIPHHAGALRGEARHPTVEDGVTIYANATVLGGRTVLGRGSVVGGSAFVTRSVPEGHTVAIEAPKLRVAPPGARGGSETPPPPRVGVTDDGSPSDER